LLFVEGKRGLQRPLDKARVSLGLEERRSEMAYLGDILPLPEWPVHPHGCVRACRYLAGDFVEGDSLERLVVVVVDRLQQGIMVAEDGEGIAGNIGLDTGQQTGRLSSGREIPR